jgi:hypothetical protein
MVNSAPRQADEDAPDAARACLCARCGAAAGDAEAEADAVLRELTGIAMDMARALRRQVMEGEAAPAQVVAADPMLALTRMARAVRLTVALRARLRAESAAAEAEAASRPEAAAAQMDQAREGMLTKLAARADLLARKAAVRRIVETAIEAEERETDDAERLFEALYDRLGEERDFSDGVYRPVEELVAIVCRDLGLNPDLAVWSRMQARPIDILPEPRARPRPGFGGTASPGPDPASRRGGQPP